MPLNYDIGSNGLIQGTDGALYGTGFIPVGPQMNGYGVFKLNPDGTGFTVLKHFDNSTNGGRSESRLIQGANDILYGTTSSGTERT